MNAVEVNQRAKFLSHAIDYSLLRIVRRYAKKYPMHEPDYISLLVQEFVPHFSYMLNHAFSEYQFTVSGIFCHQSPIVSMRTATPMKHPELGDILFVYAETDDISDKTYYNSLLLQAKMSKNPIKKVPRYDAHQLYLYQNWPEFVYITPSHLKNKIIDVQPKEINDGAQYLLINPNSFKGNECICSLSTQFIMGCAVPAQPLVVDKSLSWELIDFIKFKSGRMFEADPINTRDDWTKMIWDLIYVGANIYNRNNINHANQHRGVYCSTHNFSQTDIGKKIMSITEKWNNGERFDFINSSNQQDCGVSVVIIECKKRRPDQRPDVIKDDSNPCGDSSIGE